MHLKSKYFEWCFRHHLYYLSPPHEGHESLMLLQALRRERHEVWVMQQKMEQKLGAEKAGAEKQQQGAKKHQQSAEQAEEQATLERETELDDAIGDKDEVEAGLWAALEDPAVDEEELQDLLR